jgi:RHH-type transcriptional regulator, rel operon repressor / antitoxin RelB
MAVVLQETRLTEKTVVTVRLDDELQRRVDRLADALERPRSWVITRALEQFIAAQAWQIEEIERGIAEADAGEFTSETKVKAVFAKWRRRAR